MKSSLLLSLMFLLVTTGICHAQVVGPTKATVLEILIQPQYYSQILSQKATDIVAGVVAVKGNYTVTPRSKMEQAIKDQNISVPLNPNGKWKLGMALGVDKVISGEVTEITFTEKPRRAHVKLSLSIFDILASELVYKTLKTGDSLPTARGTDAELIGQAIKKAAEVIFNPPPVIRTAVITSFGLEVRLNRGSRDGIRVGDEAVIIEGNERRGVIRINWVSDTKSTAVLGDYSGPSEVGKTVIFVLRGEK